MTYFPLTKEQQAWKERATAIAERDVAPHAESVDKNRQYPSESLNALKQEGLWKLRVSKEHGGLGESLLTTCLIVEELAKKPCPQAFFGLLPRDEVLKATWEGNRPDLTDQTGSGYDLALANFLVRHGFSDEEIGIVILHAPYSKRTGRTADYLERAVAKARASFNGEDESGDDEEKERKEQHSVADRLIKYALNEVDDLFLDQFGQAHALVRGQAIPLPRRAYNWLRILFYDQEGKGVSPQALQMAAGTLEAKALAEGKTR